MSAALSTKTSLVMLGNVDFKSVDKFHLNSFLLKRPFFLLMDISSFSWFFPDGDDISLWYGVTGKDATDVAMVIGVSLRILTELLGGLADILSNSNQLFTYLSQDMTLQ